MQTPTNLMALLSIAASVSLLAGWRLYLCILSTGLAMRWHVLPLPDHLASLQAFASPWVIGVAGFAAICEFFADKVPWLDSVWDIIHTAIRPVGGALLAAAIIDPANPSTQVVAFILGGSGALLAHAGKSGTRAAVNTSPEPVSNIALSALEDTTSGLLLYVVYAYPYAAGTVAAGLFALTGAFLFFAWRAAKRLFRYRTAALRHNPPVDGPCEQ